MTDSEDDAVEVPEFSERRRMYGMPACCDAKSVEDFLRQWGNG